MLTAGCILILVDAIRASSGLSIIRILLSLLGLVGGLFFLYMAKNSLVDLIQRRVEMVEGQLSQKRVENKGNDAETYRFDIGDKFFYTSNREGFAALVKTYHYRVYYQPKSGNVVNVEPYSIWVEDEAD